MKPKNKTVFVGVSGGVDSSVSAALLKEQGYNVVGVFIRTWTPDFIECTWRDERRDAMRVCAHLGIPFLECDAEEAYKKGVADYMIEEYKKGNTPNPDVMCNREVKFGVFWNFAKSHGADFIATGHYAVNLFSPCEGGVPEGREGQTPPASSHLLLTGEEKFFLKQSPDNSKDQSYFLWTLTQEDLSHTLFPVGHLQKTEVRQLAKKYKLPTAVKKDSQGVCFLGPLDMKDFLRHYIKSEKGDVLLARHDSELGDEKGKIIGSHDGAVFFTLGERHGFTVSKKPARPHESGAGGEDNEKPLYVIAKDIKNNTITVSPTPGVGGDKSLDCIVSIMNTNWILGEPNKNKNPYSEMDKYTAQIRYHGEFLNCKIEIQQKQKAKIIFDKKVLVDKGQSIVIYNDDICLGGGIVE